VRGFDSPLLHKNSMKEIVIKNSSTITLLVISAIKAEIFNSLTAIDARERQLFNKLCGNVVSCQIFICAQSLIAR
jgi:hypothetical protein